MHPIDLLTRVSLVATPTLIVSYTVAGILALVLLVRPRRRRTWWRHIIPGIFLGAAIGGTAVWIVGDVLNEFDVPPTWVDRIWTGALVAAIIVAVINLFGAGAFRKVIAVVSIVAFVVAAGLAINRDVGEYQTVGQAIGTDLSEPLSLPSPKSSGAGASNEGIDPDLYRTWVAPKFMPRHGRVGVVTIPATVSGFTARQAEVYLPPAALVASAPALPVVVLMSGQPGSPSSVMISGKVPTILDAFAKKNHGLAPIVVVPDQLGTSAANPMCVNGALGNSATYLTVDVPRWIRSHLHVEEGRDAWSVGGFSQGATCALQFATAHPDLFGSFIDVSGQQYPTLTTDQDAVAQGFAGSQAAFDRAKPATIMAEKRPYRDTAAFFAAGENDAKYRHNMQVMSDLAVADGMTVERYLSPGTAHDWVTAANGFTAGFAFLYPRFGLSSGVPKS